MTAPKPNNGASPLFSATSAPRGEPPTDVLELIYEELRALAGSYFVGKHAAQTLQPTALVHEAFLRVSNRTGQSFNDQDHFFAVCAVTMRGILADQARRRTADKRGGNWTRVSLSNVERPGLPFSEVDVIELDQALTSLAARSERQARIVEYRFFAGMSETQIARVMDLSRSTVQEDWRMARAWLAVRLRKGQSL